MSTGSRKEREKRPLLLNDDEGGAPPPYVGVGEMDRPFGTSSMRYWALFVFVALSVTQNIAWIAFSTILDAAEKHYDITAAQTNRLVEVATIVFIPGVFIFSPLSDKFGLKVVVIASCLCVCIGGVCRWVGDSYTWLFIGQAFNGLAGPIIMNAPPQLAAAWFPPRHRATATAIGWSAQCIGVAIGYLIAPMLCPEPSDLPYLMKVLGYQGIALLALSFTFPSAPLIAPSASAAVEKTGFVSGLRPAAKNWSLGFAANLMNMAGSIIIPPLVSGKYMQRRWKWIVVVLQGMAAVAVGAFTYFLYDLYPYTNHSNQSNHSNHSNLTTYTLLDTRSGEVWGAGSFDSFGPAGDDGRRGLMNVGSGLDSVPAGFYAFGSVFCLGSFFFGGSSVIGLELASEIVFPVSEESAAAYMTLLYMVFNIATMEAGNVLSGKAINIGVASLLACCAAIVIPIKVGNKRMTIDET
eukprot:gene3293-28038_t